MQIFVVDKLAAIILAHVEQTAPNAGKTYESYDLKKKIWSCHLFFFMTPDKGYITNNNGKFLDALCCCFFCFYSRKSTLKLFVFDGGGQSQEPITNVA